MKPVKWGIISTANIGMQKVIPGMMKSKQLEVLGIASRNCQTSQSRCRSIGHRQVLWLLRGNARRP